ncbi:MAG: quinolinate synthase NadA, partial [Planctomycetota bacterium]|nr:quinolinate synthase NadA [Planctomycetota bacterium]
VDQFRAKFPGVRVLVHPECTREVVDKADISGSTGRIIREVEPPHPSTRLTSLGEAGTKIAVARRAQLDALTKQLRSELEWIPLMAMRKERDRRYASPLELAADIRNYLVSLPLRAGPESVGYRLRKYVSRNRAPLGAIAAIIILLISGVAISTQQAIRARKAERSLSNQLAVVRQERDRADRSAAEARAMGRLAEERLADGLVFAGDSLVKSGDCANARDSYFKALEICRKLGNPDLGIQAALLESYVAGPPPLMGDDGKRVSIGGFTGHTDFVHAVAFSPDGRTAISSADTLKLWDVATGKDLRSFTGHTAWVTSVAISPDGRTAISGSQDQTLKLWDVATGKEIRCFTGHKNRVKSVGFSPDGRTALSGSSDGTLKTWDVSTGKEIRSFTGHQSSVQSVAFSPDGRTALSGSFDTTLKLWDVATGKEIRSFTGRTSAVLAVAFAPDGRTAVSGCIAGTLKLWDVATGKEIRSFTGHTAWVTSVAFSPDGRKVVSGSQDNTVKLWDVAAGMELRSFTGHTIAVQAVAFSPDGRTVVSGGADNAIKLWDVMPGKELRSLIGDTSDVSAVAISPDGRMAVSGSRDNTLKLWDVATGMELRSIAGPPRTIGAEASSAVAVAFSPDGRKVVSGNSDNTLSLWDVATGSEIRRFTGHTGIVRAVAFSPDGRAVVSGSGGDDNTLKLWDVATGAEIRRFVGDTRGVRSVAFSSDGRTVVSGSLGTLKLWDVATGSELRSFTGDTMRGWIVAISPDGRTAASGTGSADNMLKLWDVATGKELRSFSAQISNSFTGHPGRITDLAISPDGRLAVSIGEDTQLKLWDLSRPARYLDFGQVLPKARDALTRNPVDPAALATFGEWYAFRGFDDWAVEFFEKARQNGGDIPSLTLARCYWQLDKLNEAKIEFEKAMGRNEAPEFYLRMCIDAVPQTILSSYLASYRDYASKGQFTEAAQACARAVAISPDDHWLRYQNACLLVQIGDMKGYRQEGQKMLELFGNTEDRAIADRVAKACLFAPESGIDLSKACALADRAVSAGDHEWLCYFQVAKGLAEYRVGRFKEASNWLTQSVTATRGSPAVHCFIEGALCLAMAQHRLGNADEAVKLLREAVEALEQKVSKPGDADFGAGFHDWIICQTLRREAEALIGATPTTLNDTAWRSVRFAPVAVDAAHKAVTQARDALRGDPDKAYILNTLGVALYRADQFKDALDPLARSAAMSPRGGDPADWAFIAMVRWKLNQPDEARAALAKLRALAEMDRWKTDEETTRWLKEAETLINRTPTTAPASQPVGK